METQGSLFTVMRGGEVLGIVVCKVSGAGFPVDDKLTIFDAIFEPIKAHVNCFGALLFDCVIQNATGHTVVSCDDGGGLWPAHFMKGCAKRNSGLSIDESRAGLGLGGGRKHIAHDSGENMESAIEGRQRAVEFVRVGAQKEVAGGPGAGFASER